MVYLLVLALESILNKNMKKKYTLLLSAIFFLGTWVKSQNYVHTLSNISYLDLPNPQVINGTDSIASGYYIDISMLFPAFGAIADFNSVPSIPSPGAYVARNGYLGVYENPSFTHTFAFHAYLNDLKRINSTSSISVLQIPSGTFKILKFQWKNMGIRNHSDTEYVNFQIWFDEANKSVSYHYGHSMLNNGPNNGGAIGLLRAPNNFSSFTNATYLKGDAKNPDQLEEFNPTSFSNLIGSTNFPPAGTLITFKLPTSSIKQYKLHKINYSIVPNPFNESLKIQCVGNFNWQILDIYGKQIMHGTAYNEVMVNTTEIAYGSYIIKLEKQNEVAFEKLVK